MKDSVAAGKLIASARVEADALVAVIAGDIDLNNSPELRSGMLNLIVRHTPRRLVLNLGRVPYMDSSAIAVLVEMLRRLGKGGKVILTNLQPRVKGLVEIAKLDAIFVLAATEQEAIAK